MKRLLLLFPFSAFALQVIDDPSVQHYVKVSLRDVNRIYCENGNVGSVAYSKEKRIELVKEGRNLFLKILPIKKEQKLIYEDVPRELFVECGGEVFSIIVVPREVPSETIVLRVKKPDLEKAVRFEQGEFTEFVTTAIRFAYRDVPPDGYEEKKVGKKFKEFKELDLYLLKVYEGAEFSVLVFEIRAKEDVYLDPAAFVPYVHRPVALSLVKEKLRRGERTRLFVVVRKDA